MMSHIGFKPCVGDPVVWMKESVKEKGSKYWECILLYVDGCLATSVNAKQLLQNEISKYFKLKEASIGPPDINLGDKMRQVEFNNGVKAWLL